MEIGVIGLDAIGVHIVRRLMAAGHQCVVFDTSPRRVAEIAAEKAYGAASVADLAHELEPPRTIWLAGEASDAAHAVQMLRPVLIRGDLIIDATNGDYLTFIERARDLIRAGVDYVRLAVTEISDDRLLRSLVISGDEDVLRRIEPLLRQVRSVPEPAGIHASATR